SLGVYEIARKICDIFENHYTIEKIGANGWNREERLVTLCAALLHDVGHGPYSHTFEHIFHTNHEEITVEIITNPHTAIYQILKRVGRDFPEKVASVMQKTYPMPQVVQMISSQIDADRMDYLLRDAYYTGTEYGTFDLTRILRDIRPCKEGITFSISGMHAIEDYIISRYQIYRSEERREEKEFKVTRSKRDWSSDVCSSDLVQMISSQIDADRMDYLLRDAYYTGTEYGTFDLTRILRDIRPCKEGITFSISGMHAIEDYIISRYQMY